ncbi:MAG: WS/DGAT domain-containing protein [Xanthomonadales bacterium]|nr:WS/DGAT domain-containing protein [Xanthomonadales bacterium]
MPDRAGLRRALAWTGQLVDLGGQVVRDPSLGGVLLREGVQIARELARVLTLGDDPPTPLRSPLGPEKAVAWAEPLPLEEVKAIGRAYDCTVNDVLLAAASGALRRYLLDSGFDPAGLAIRATVPVNLRPLEHARRLGNHFGLVFLELPVGEENPVARLERVAAGMRELKGSRQALLAFGLLGALGMGPAALQRPALELLSRKATVVATNVPGPQQPLYLAGARIADIMFWVPQSGSIGVGLSILSYDGQVRFGVIGDRNCLPAPRAVVERFRPELECLLHLALLEDWSRPVTAADAEAWRPLLAGAERAERRGPRSAAKAGESRAARRRGAR